MSEIFQICRDRGGEDPENNEENRRTPVANSEPDIESSQEFDGIPAVPCLGFNSTAIKNNYSCGGGELSEGGGRNSPLNNPESFSSSSFSRLGFACFLRDIFPIWRFINNY